MRTCRCADRHIDAGAVSRPRPDRRARRAGDVHPRRPRRRRDQGRAAGRRRVAARGPARRRRARRARQPALPRVQPRQAQRRARPRQRGRPPSSSCDLVATADFVFENAGPGAMAGRGLGFAALCDARPDLVYVAISPFGQDGPYAHHLATDLTLAAMGGAMALNGEPDRRPVRITVPQTWYHAAAEGALGALVAHHRRAGHGRGPVRRRVRAGGRVLDRAERHDRPRHPGPRHRAQRHGAAAEHADDTARLPVRRRRGRADRHVGDAGRAWCRGWSRAAP